ncbi:hypothetical protein GF354_00630 [Candidatus Peregrinibacteria bacterium]|nr:hypothetical protein [Candidatus Peregrinibacteria bacterium]
MKNKNIFLENRLVFKKLEIKEDIPGVSPSAKEKASRFIEKLAGSDENADKVASGLNPFLKEMISYFESIQEKKLNFTDVIDEKENLKMILKHADGTETAIEGEPYLALNWGNILESLNSYDGLKEFSPALIKTTIENDFTFAREAIEAVARGEELTPEQIENARIDFDSARPLLDPESYAARMALKKKTERTKKDLEIPETENAKTEEALKQLDKLKTNISDSDAYAIAVEKEMRTPLSMEESKNIRENKINTADWQMNTMYGLARAYSDIESMGLPIDSEVYTNAFAILRDAIDPEKNPYKNNPDTAEWFQDPFSHMDQIEALSKDFDGKSYVSAYNLLLTLKAKAIEVNANEKAKNKIVSEMDEVPGLSTIEDFYDDNVDRLRYAIKSRDWFTVGAYALGGYMIYKSAKYMFSGANEKYKKWATYALGAGALGMVFFPDLLKSALKEADILDEDYEIQGTSMEVLKRVLAGAPPKAKEGLDEVDGKFMAKMSGANLSHLIDEFEKADDKGMDFISPHEFPAEFEELTLVSGFNADTTEKLSADQRAFQDTGREIFNFVFAMRVAYYETLYKKDPDFSNTSFEDAMRSPALRGGRVIDFFNAIEPYSTRETTEWTTDERMLDNARENLRKSFGNLDIAFEVDGMPERSKEKIADYTADRFYGSLMGYPVRFVLDGKKDTYRIYFAEEYMSDETPGPDFFAEIPKEGGDESSAKKAVEKMKAHVTSLLEPVMSKDSNIVPGSLKYEDSRWTYKFINANSERFGMDSKEYTGEVTFNAEGEPLLDGRETFENDLFDKVVKTNPELSVLAPLVKDHVLEIEVLKDEPKLALVMRGTNVTMRYILEYQGDKFKLSNIAQQSLISQPKFQEYYVNERMRDPLVKKSVENIEDFIDEASGSFFKDVERTYSKALFEFEFLSGPKMFADALEGQVPDNYAEMIVKRKVDYIKYALLGKIREAKTFDEVKEIEEKFFTPMVKDLKNVSESITDKDSDEWGQDEFFVMLETFDRTGKSQAYHDALLSVEQDAVEKFGTITDIAYMSGHEEIYKYVNIFVYKTAALDDPRFDTSTSPFEGDLKFKDGYLKYVKDALKANYDEDNLPHPAGATEVKSYSEWHDDNISSDIEPLNDENNGEPLSNSREGLGEYELTPLEKAYREEHAKMYIVLRDLFKDNLVPSQYSSDGSALETYFESLYSPEKGQKLEDTIAGQQCKKIAQDSQNKYQQMKEIRKITYGHAREALDNDDLWKDIDYNKRWAKFRSKQ